MHKYVHTSNAHHVIERPNLVVFHHAHKSCNWSCSTTIFNIAHIESSKRNNMPRPLSISSEETASSASSSSSEAYEKIRCEMEELRSASRAELLKSWDDMERVEDEKHELVIRNWELASELDTVVLSELALVRQVNELKQQLGQVDEDECEGWKSNGRGSARSVFSFAECVGEEQPPATVPSVRQQYPPCWTWNINRRSPRLQEEKERLEDDLHHRLDDMERERELIIAKWVKKVSCRDELFDQLEKEFSRQFEERERQNQRIIEGWKEREASGVLMLKRTEQVHRINIEMLDQLQRQVRTLEKKLHSKEKYISKQNDKMNEYESYIEDLTSELELIYRPQPVRG